MAKLRTWAEWEKAGLSKAERFLAERCKAGESCLLGDGERPDAPSPERTISADFLRYLILGGCAACPVAEFGVFLTGAYVTGWLDLNFCTARGMTALHACCFEDSISAMQAKFDLLSLQRSAFPGLNAHKVEVTGNVFLNQTEVSGMVRLGGALIGEHLDCTEATLRHALDVREAKVNGHVYLKKTMVEGEVSLIGTKISGQLVCSGAALHNAGGYALSAQQMRVEGGFFWRDVMVEGTIHLAAAHVSYLEDDLGSWPADGCVFLNGFTYDRIAGSFTDAKRRLDWLRRGTVREGEFFPLPYTHLANVLRKMGHVRDARKVLIERERIKRRYIRRRARIEPDGTWGVGFRSYGVDLWNILRWVWSNILRILTGYGYAPWRSLWALSILWLFGVWVADEAWKEGSFAPNDGPILVSDGWQRFAMGDFPNPAEAWSAECAPGQDWDSFNRYGYAADLVVPILDLGQTAAWAPSKERGKWGHRLWWGRWVLASLGWVVTAIGAAALAGVGRRWSELGGAIDQLRRADGDARSDA